MKLDPENPRSTEDAILATLVALHRKKVTRARASSGESAYQRVVEHFSRRGQRLRGERLVTAEMLERLVSAARRLPSAPAQQELAVRGPAGGVAAARLRIVNRTGRPERAELVIGEPEGAHPSSLVVVTPQRFGLESGAAVVVRIAVHLDGWREGDTLTLPIECRRDGRRDRIWVVVSATAREEGTIEW